MRKDRVEKPQSYQWKAGKVVGTEARESEVLEK